MMARQSLQLFFLKLCPSVTILCAMMLSALPIMQPALQGLLPSILPTIIFFWALYLPAYCPVILVFIIGLLQDILTNNLFGTHALFYSLIVVGTIKLQDILLHYGYFMHVMIAVGGMTLLFMVLSLVVIIGHDDYHLTFLFTKYVISVSFIPILWYMQRYMLYKLTPQL